MKNKRLFMQVAEKLADLIDRGVYPPGSRIPPGRELSEELNVSRPTLREAVIALEVMGKVEVITGSGVYVCEPKASIPSADKISAFELTQARALIEGEAAALAAATITAEELATLERTLQDMLSGPKPDDADREFHLTIARATRNQAVLLSILNLWDLRENAPSIKAAYRGVCNHQSHEARIQEHRDIFDAIKAGNPAKARAAMHEHFNRLINALFDASEAQAMEEIKRRTSETRDLYSLNRVVSSLQ